MYLFKLKCQYCGQEVQRTKKVKLNTCQDCKDKRIKEYTEKNKELYSQINIEKRKIRKQYYGGENIMHRELLYKMVTQDVKRKHKKLSTTQNQNKS
jgi:hypothetical protein